MAWPVVRVCACVFPQSPSRQWHPCFALNLPPSPCPISWNFGFVPAIAPSCATCPPDWDHGMKLLRDSSPACPGSGGGLLLSPCLPSPEASLWGWFRCLDGIRKPTSEGHPSGGAFLSFVQLYTYPSPCFFLRFQPGHFERKGMPMMYPGGQTVWAMDEEALWVLVPCLGHSERTEARELASITSSSLSSICIALRPLEPLL